MNQAGCDYRKRINAFAMRPRVGAKSIRRPKPESVCIPPDLGRRILFAPTLGQIVILSAIVHPLKKSCT